MREMSHQADVRATIYQFDFTGNQSPAELCRGVEIDRPRARTGAAEDTDTTQVCSRHGADFIPIRDLSPGFHRSRRGNGGLTHVLERSQSVMLKKIGLYLMAALYTTAGIMHFVNPEFFLKIVPPYLPWPLALVYISGVAEIILGIALCIPATRRFAAFGVILLLVAVFPANVYHYTSGGAGMEISEGLLIARLFLQGVLIAWAYVYTRK